MGLYAFDGTLNLDEQDCSQDTNVVRFRELYGGVNSEFLAGVGIRWGRAGKMLGGIFGAGGKTRIDEMYELLSENFRKGDEDIDIIGFSRGAALAVHFANRIAKEGIKLDSGEVEKPKIRFLGIWDLVGSFGLSFDTFIDFHEINLGLDIDSVAGQVEQCCHAIALDERRETFGLTQLNQDGQHSHIQEVWFRGVHSDVGGGNQNTDRSNIALKWMLDGAEKAGVPIDREKASDPKYDQTERYSKISVNKDVQRDKRRMAPPEDSWHEWAVPKRLNPGESHRFEVLAELKYNWSGVKLQPQRTYKFTVALSQEWIDGDIKCGPGGWKTEQLSWTNERIVDLFERKRRYPKANWFELIGALGDEDDQLFRVLEFKDRFQPPMEADLYMFANDLKSKYQNNKGSIWVEIECVS